MAKNTKIEWCDHSWNPWLGCTKVGPACEFCYAEDMMTNRYGRVSWGAGEDRVRTSPENWRQPFRWNRAAESAGRRATVFCLSLGDIWDNEVDPRWRRDAFEVMEQTPFLTWLLLSKRIGNADKMCDPMAGNPCLPRNAALGATMVTQEEWDRDAPKLEDARDRLGAMFSFASVEPMLGPIDARMHMPNWIICGGESGRNARPIHPAWARSLRDQCAAAGATFFFKQWGEWQPAELVNDGRPEPWRKTPDGKQAWELDELKRPRAQLAPIVNYKVGKKAAGRLLDGIEHNGMPSAP